MDYLIVHEGIIENVVVFNDEELAKIIGALPYYPGADIGLPYTPEPEPEPSGYIPTPEQSAVVMMRAAFSAQVADMDDDQIIQCSGLADDWAPGDHKQGEVYNANDQTWECYQDYNNDVYTDVRPGNPSWYTFNRPLHGKSPETARPWVKPQHGTTDIYHIGECMVYTDGKVYECQCDTNFSPDEYAADWKVING